MWYACTSGIAALNLHLRALLHPIQSPRFESATIAVPRISGQL